MACFYPQTVYMPLEGGQVSFVERRNSRSIKIPCRNCIGCRVRRQTDVAVRMVCESKMFEECWFPTFTYSDEHLPLHSALVHRDMQLCFKRARKEFGKFRFALAGEYGDSFGRPHYHAVTFGLSLPDIEVCSSVYSKERLYRSDALEKCWGKGQVRIGAVNFSVAQYIATYCVKRVNGSRADDHYGFLVPETGEMVSRPPEYGVWSKGLGLSFLRKYWREIIASGHDGIVIDGAKRPIPRYFLDKLKANAEAWNVPKDVLADWEYRVFRRLVDGEADATPERLADREIVALSRKAFYASR